MNGEFFLSYPFLSKNDNTMTQNCTYYGPEAVFCRKLLSLISSHFREVQWHKGITVQKCFEAHLIPSPIAFFLLELWLRESFLLSFLPAG